MPILGAMIISLTCYVVLYRLTELSRGLCRDIFCPVDIAVPGGEGAAIIQTAKGCISDYVLIKNLNKELVS